MGTKSLSSNHPLGHATIRCGHHATLLATFKYRAGLSQSDRVIWSTKLSERLIATCLYVEYARDAYLCYKSVDEHSFVLSKPVDPEDRLYIMGGVPRYVKHNHSVGSYKIDPQTTSLSRDQKQACAGSNNKQINDSSIHKPTFDYVNCFLGVKDTFL